MDLDLDVDFDLDCLIFDTLLHGLRSDLESLYGKLESPLTDLERQHLVDMGINPDRLQ